MYIRIPCVSITRLSSALSYLLHEPIKKLSAIFGGYKRLVTTQTCHTKAKADTDSFTVGGGVVPLVTIPLVTLVTPIARLSQSKHKIVLADVSHKLSVRLGGFG